jgi:prepilin signal peptidase PulO-like enzyme (type II secretory pathway)
MMVGLILLSTSIFDIRGKEIPFRILYSSSWLVLTQVLIRFLEERPPINELVLTLLPGMFLFLVARITGKVGYADAWIVCLIGLCEGLADCFVILTLGMVLCGIFATVLLAMHKVKPKTKLAFIPFMMVAFVITIL